MSAWLHTLGPPRQPLVRLFCFPHAGGTSTAFRLWRDALPEQVELVGIQLPGRGGRLREPPISDIPTLTRIITSELLPSLDRPYAFFGHSMGSVLAIEVARAAVEAGQPAPAHIFLSARRPPHLPRLETDLHRLPDEAFLKLLNARYGGVPAEVLQEKELLDLLLPAVRADITALETFTPPEAEPVSCAITAYGGDADPLVALDHLRAWRDYTSGAFRVKQFRGGHFYLQNAKSELLADINQVLTPLLTTAAEGRLVT